MYLEVLKILFLFDYFTNNDSSFNKKWYTMVLSPIDLFQYYLIIIDTNPSLTMYP